MFVWSLVCLTQRVCFSLLAYSLRRSCVSVRLGFFFPLKLVDGRSAAVLHCNWIHVHFISFALPFHRIFQRTTNNNNKNHLRYSQLTYTIVYRCVSYSGAKRLPHSKYPHTVITFMLCCAVLCVAAFLFIRIRKKITPNILYTYYSLYATFWVHCAATIWYNWYFVRIQSKHSIESSDNEEK